MRKTAALAALAALIGGAALTPSGPASARVGPSIPNPLPEQPGQEPEADTLISYGEYAEGGARVEIVDLDTGERRVVEDSRGEDRSEAGIDHDHGGGGGEGPEAAATGDRCSNDGEFTYLAGVDRYWHRVEPWTFNPTNAPGAAPDWRNEIKAASDVWQHTTNPCGLPDTVGWVSPTTWTDDTAANVPKNNCLDNPSDGKNTFGWRAFDNFNFVAYACVFRSGTWVIEGDVGFNTLQNFCHGCPPGPGGYDVRAAALHEWGHILGLGHNCTGMPWWGNPGSDPCDTPAEEAAVMVPELRNAIRDLSLGDIQGARALYPAEQGYEVHDVTLVNDAPGQKLAPGHQYTVHVDLKNVGMREWKVDDAGHVLATRDGGASEFADAGWVSTSRPTRIDSDMTNGPDNDAQTIVRDEIGRLTFTARIPFARAGQTPSLEAMGLLGPAGFFTGAAPGLTFDVGTFDAALDNQVAVPVLVQGVEGPEVWVDMENTGTAPWFVDETVSLAAVDAATGSGRCSTFASPGWTAGCTTASLVTENVTRTVLPIAPSLLPVRPGDVGRFRFRFASPIDPGLIGLHHESFKPKAFATDGPWFGAPTAVDLIVL